MANARLSLPVWILEAYGGAGLGGLYYDADGILSGDDVDGWLFAGNVFLGGDLALADKVTLGVEAKYYMTEDTSFGGLDGIAAFLTLGVRF
jgi:opacity protein-like surface antigen